MQFVITQLSPRLFVYFPMCNLTSSRNDLPFSCLKVFENCFLNHKDEVCGVDPTVFRRFYHEEIEEFDEDVAEPQYVDKRCDVSRFKQPKLF